MKTGDTALDLLEALRGHNEMTPSELADRQNVAKSTVHRHLTTLLDRGYVVREGEHSGSVSDFWI